MKILHIISSMDPNAGGTSQAVRNMIPNLQKFHTDNEVICFDNPDLVYGGSDDFKIYKIGNGKTSYQYQPLLIKWLKINLSQYEAVIVHGIWQYHNYAIYKASLGLKKQKITTPKIIIMPHGMLDPYFQKAVNRKWKALRNDIVWMVTEQKAINAADAVFFTCEEELLLARNTFKGYEPKKEINVGLGILPSPKKTVAMQDAFYNSVPSLKTKYWLFLSRIDPKKGIELLIEAYNQLCVETVALPDLVIAGPTDSLYAQKMIIKAKSNTKIHFTGMLKGEAKWGAFYDCDAYLLPSYQENFGIAIVEAMSCKKPVVISKNINIWNEIEAGRGGWILDKLSISIIQTTLLKISQLSTLEIENKGELAYQTYDKKFKIEECAKAFVQALKEI
jgi:glycosyltransferase involved in cell wall biosynthesis